MGRILASQKESHSGNGYLGLPTSSPTTPWSSFEVVPLSELEKRTVGELDEAQQEPHSEMDSVGLHDLAKALGATWEQLQAAHGSEDQLRNIIQSLKPVDDGPDKVLLR